MGWVKSTPGLSALSSSGMHGLPSLSFRDLIDEKFDTLPSLTSECPLRFYHYRLSLHNSCGNQQRALHRFLGESSWNNKQSSSKSTH